MTGDADFDIQAAWLRRFNADARSNLNAFALRLQEAMPDAVTILRTRPLFGRPETRGVTIGIDQSRYTLEIEQNRLRASIATVVRGIAISNKAVDPVDWFARLSAETRQASAQAAALSRSIATFMAAPDRHA